MKLHIGAGNKILSGWINCDIVHQDGIDLVFDLNSMEFPEGTVDAIYACHIIEHIEKKSVPKILSNFHKWLRPGGSFFVAVPDFASIVERYNITKNLSELTGLIMGGQKNEHDFHKTIYDKELMSALLVDAGFEKIKFYDWRYHDVGMQGLDDFSQAYLPHMQKESGQLMSLNLVASKPQA